MGSKEMRQRTKFWALVAHERVHRLKVVREPQLAKQDGVDHPDSEVGISAVPNESPDATGDAVQQLPSSPDVRVREAQRRKIQRRVSDVELVIRRSKQSVDEPESGRV